MIYSNIYLQLKIKKTIPGTVMPYRDGFLSFISCADTSVQTEEGVKK